MNFRSLSTGLLPCSFQLHHFVLVILLLSGCAAIRPTPSLLTPSEFRKILKSLELQEQAVSSFYSMGTLVLRKWLVESEEARVLVVGTRDPLRIKLEITHSWGSPLLHILIDGDRLEAFSFPDATLYTGNATMKSLGRFMPSPPNMDSIWALLRGYPALPGAGQAIAAPGGGIVCNRNCVGSPWILHARPGDMEPKRLVFLESSLEVIFSDIRKHQEVKYAGQVEVRPGKGSGKVIIKNEKMVFNQEIPEQIFQIKKPRAYRLVELDEEAS